MDPVGISGTRNTGGKSTGIPKVELTVQQILKLAYAFATKTQQVNIFCQYYTAKWLTSSTGQYISLSYCWAVLAAQNTVLRVIRVFFISKTDEKFYAECDEISELSSLYGAVVGSSIVVAMLCIFSVMVITKSLSWKRIRYVSFNYLHIYLQ